jgi:hypothetical protein
MYGNTTYGSGDVFNTGGNSGSSLPGVSVGGADLNSPEMIAAKAKYEAACATSSNPNEVIIGGIQASNCREATTEWLRALSQSQTNNVSSSNDTSENDYSSDSISRDKDLEEFMEEMLSKVDSTKNGDELAGYSCSDKNSYVKSKTECACKDGYIMSTKNVCVLEKDVNQENCSALDSKAFYNASANNCQCSNGYVVDKNNKCVSASSYCIGKTGINSYSEGNLCVCSKGYVIGKNEKCISMANWCIEMDGINSHQEGNQCFCNERYYYDNSSKKCKKDTENIGTSTMGTQNQDTYTQDDENEVWETPEIQPVKKLKWYQRLFDWLF